MVIACLGFPGESYVVPIGDLAIILNPTSEPAG